VYQRAAVEKMSRKVKTPTVLQMEATECGAAALAIVMGYHQRFIPLDVLRVECGVSRDGSKAINMLRAARQHGMIAKGARVEQLEALDQLNLPYIVFWGFDHFVVVEGRRGQQFYINDPATGRRTVSAENFNQAFTGVVLTITPGPDFEKQGSPPSVLNPLKERLAASTGALAFIVFVTIALIVPGLMVAGFTKVFIDNILIQNIEHWVFPLLGGMVLTAFMRGMLVWLQHRYLLRLQIKIALTQSARFFWHTLHLPIAFFQQRYAGDISERIEANDRIALLLSNNLTASIVGLITLIFYAIAMAILNWQLSIFVITVAAANAALFYFVTRRIADRSRILLQESGQLAGFEASGLFAIETLKASVAENDFFGHWAGLHARTINSQQRIELYNGALEVIPQFFGGLATVAVLGYGSVQIIHGEITVGTLVAFQSLMMSFQAPIATLLSLGVETQEIRGDLMRLDDGLKHPVDPSFTSMRRGESPARERIDAVAFHQVDFGYSPLDPPIIEDVSFQLAPTKQLAIVGQTGSGKSTVARLVCRLFRPWSGFITFGTEPQEEIDPQLLADSLAFVDQDIFLFEGTVSDNLTLWDTGLTQEQQLRALADACLDDVIAQRGGLDSRVAEGGANFSGGECQRLEIARALTSNPSVLIFDEATASLDPIVEKRIYQNIKRRNCAVLIIAHRLSAIRDCDEILVLEQGRIVQRGSHVSLMETNGPYQQLVTGELLPDG
jgi:NHLM bacteriocin system ABC transporter peptidase/ATP-binding protein